MNIFFGKISDKYDVDQITEGYYQAPKDSTWFNGIDVGDYAFILAGNKIQLWKARAWSEMREGANDRLDFDIIISDTKLKTKDLVAFKYFKLTTDLIVKSARSTGAEKKAFFKLEVDTALTEEALLNEGTYLNTGNFRSIKTFLPNQSPEIDSYDIQIQFDNGQLKLLPIKNCAADLISRFKDNIRYRGKGQPQKDKTLSLVSATGNVGVPLETKIGIKELYDAFMCEYQQITQETNFWVVNGFEKDKIEYDLDNSLFIMQWQYDSEPKSQTTIQLNEAKKIKEGDKVLLYNKNHYYAYGTFVKCDVIGTQEKTLGQQIKDKSANTEGDIITYTDAPCYFEDLTATNGFDGQWGQRLSVESWEGINRNGVFIPGIASHVPYNVNTILKLNDGSFYEKVKNILSNQTVNIMAQQKIDQIAVVLENKKQIILQGPPGTGKTYTAKDVAELILLGSVTDDKALQKLNLEGTERFKLVQFHPSYTYEDFVRGIVAKSNGSQLEYITENKILGEFAKKANENYTLHNAPAATITKYKWVEERLKELADNINDDIDSNGPYKLNATVNIIEVEKEAFIYNGNWESSKGHRMKFKDIIEGYIQNSASRREFKSLRTISGSARQHATYYFLMLEKLRESITTPFPKDLPTIKPEIKKYVIIIDEINRANLPSVLGELIYALEYRGQSVESIYSIDGDNSIIIPPNLYIIGTMNTADRSVGHIDYAIKRRFAFENVPPNVDVILNAKAKELFTKISELFTEEYLASDFDKDDVQLGHSYFIVKDNDELKLKLKYEIVPILKEYKKDGLLKENAKDKLEEIKNFAI